MNFKSGEKYTLKCTCCDKTFDWVASKKNRRPQYHPDCRRRFQAFVITTKPPRVGPI